MRAPQWPVPDVIRFVKHQFIEREGKWDIYLAVASKVLVVFTTVLEEDGEQVFFVLVEGMMDVICLGTDYANTTGTTVEQLLDKAIQEWEDAHKNQTGPETSYYSNN